jgi:ketosteroid isomerase-like protein
MDRRRLIALAAICFAGSPAAVAQAPPAPTVNISSPSAAEAASVVDAFHAALRRNDTAAALALLTDDVLIFEGGRVERSKAEYAGHHAPADAAYAAAVTSTLQKRTATADGASAWIASESRATGRYKDKPVDQLTTESIVLRKEADGWRIAHIHWSSRAAPK